MRLPRSSGILLPIASLPGPQGIGSIGPEAHRFVDFLFRTGQSIWQVLPLGPLGYGDSPYQGASVFAGNPLLISLESICRDGWLSAEDWVPAPDLNRHEIDYQEVAVRHRACLTAAATRFMESARPQARKSSNSFVMRMLGGCTTSHSLRRSNRLTEECLGHRGRPPWHAAIRWR